MEDLVELIQSYKNIRSNKLNEASLLQKEATLLQMVITHLEDIVSESANKKD